MNKIKFLLSISFISLASNEGPQKETLVRVTATTLMKNSDEFEKRIRKFGSGVGFSTQGNRIKTLLRLAPDWETGSLRDRLEKYANRTYPIIDRRVYDSLKRFIEIRQGVIQEHLAELYRGEFVDDVDAKKNLSLLVSRFLQKRPISFVGASDTALLRSGEKKTGWFEELDPYCVCEYMDYKEIMMSQFIGISSPTVFINNGARDNCGKPQAATDFEEFGIYVGLVGPRFEKRGYMDWTTCVVDPKQNIETNGYGANPGIKVLFRDLELLSDLYGVKFPNYQDAKEDTTGRFIRFQRDEEIFYFDTLAYKKRLELTILPYLCEAQRRGELEKREVYCHIVGLGLGVWAIPEVQKIQQKNMFSVYKELIKDPRFNRIKVIDFSHFDCKDKTTYIDGKVIRYSKRNPADKLTGEDAGKLVVAQYAWDGNSYPGNEYWLGNLNASGNPSAACFSTIVETQNPEINDNVCGDNLVVYDINQPKAASCS